MRLRLKWGGASDDIDGMVVITPQQQTFSAGTTSAGAIACPRDTVVCHCYRVAESVIREAIEVLGASTVAEVTATSRAGGGCNGCHCRIRRMLAGKPATCSVFEVCASCGFNTAQCECRAA